MPFQTMAVFSSNLFGIFFIRLFPINDNDWVKNQSKLGRRIEIGTWDWEKLNYPSVKVLFAHCQRPARRRGAERRSYRTYDVPDRRSKVITPCHNSGGRSNHSCNVEKVNIQKFYTFFMEFRLKWTISNLITLVTIWVNKSPLLRGSFIMVGDTCGQIVHDWWVQFPRQKYRVEL